MKFSAGCGAIMKWYEPLIQFVHHNPVIVWMVVGIGLAMVMLCLALMG